MSSSDSYLSDRLSSQMEYIDVKVHNPTIHNTHNDGRYTTYEVSLQTNSLSFTLNRSVVQRRYSDFIWLRRALSQTTTIKPPNLPMGRFFGIFNEKYLEERQVILTNFLQKIVRETLFLSSSALHLFMQTQLDRKAMTKMLKDAKRRGSMNSITRAVAMYGSACTDWSACTDESPCSTIVETHRASIDSGHGESGEFSANQNRLFEPLSPPSCHSSHSSLRDFGSAENNNHKNEDDFVVCDQLPINSSPISIDKTAYTDVLWKVDSFSASPIPINCGPFNDALRSSHTSRSLGNKLRLNRHSLSSQIRRVASDSNVPARGKTGMFHLGESSDNDSSISGQQTPGDEGSPKTTQNLQQVSQILKSKLQNNDEVTIEKQSKDQVIPVVKIEDTDKSTPNASSSLSKNKENMPKSDLPELISDPTTKKDDSPNHEHLDNDHQHGLDEATKDDKNDISESIANSLSTNHQTVIDENSETLLNNQNDTFNQSDVKTTNSVDAMDIIDDKNEIIPDKILSINNDEESNIVITTSSAVNINSNREESKIKEITTLPLRNEVKTTATGCNLVNPKLIGNVDNVVEQCA